MCVYSTISLEQLLYILVYFRFEIVCLKSSKGSGTLSGLLRTTLPHASDHRGAAMHCSVHSELHSYVSCSKQSHHGSAWHYVSQHFISHELYFISHELYFVPGVSDSAIVED